MDIKVVFKEKKQIRLDFLEFGEGKDRVVLTWNSSGLGEPGIFYGDNVLIGEKDEDAGGKLKEIMFKKLTALQVYDPGEDRESDWAEIETITFADGKDKYYVPDILLHRFQTHEINEKDLHMTLTVEDYEKLADHVRKTDKLDNIRNCIDLHLEKTGYDNIFDYLERKLQNDSDNMADMYTDPSNGYDEEVMLNHIISHYGGMARYKLISNRGTENETENTVLLMKEAADHLIDNIRERDNGSDMLLEKAEPTLTDEDSGEVDIIYVDEIEFIKDEEL